MRQLLFAGLSVIGLVAIVVSSSPSLARSRARKPAVAATSISPAGIQDRYCLQGEQAGYPGNCEFSTYAQCLATASGTGAGCGENLQYLFAEPRRSDWPPR
jgi:Protein of unknown function (DUF3551)